MWPAASRSCCSDVLTVMTVRDKWGPLNRKSRWNLSPLSDVCRAFCHSPPASASHMLWLQAGAAMLGSTINFYLFIFIYCFMCMGVLPVCLSVQTCMSAVPSKARRGHCVPPWNSSYRQLLVAMWVLGIDLGPVEEQPVLLAAEPSLQHRQFLMIVFQCSSSFL